MFVSGRRRIPEFREYDRDENISMSGWGRTWLESSIIGHPVVLLVILSVQKMAHNVRLLSSFSDQSLGGGKTAIGPLTSSRFCNPII